jgi:DNA-binding helix-hairpin-helix protein with protein kinase domain
MASQTYFDNEGVTVAIGAQLGRGGEGAVFEVSRQQQLVAKIYHALPDAQKSQKLGAMVELYNTRVSALAAWPIRTLHKSKTSSPVGFLMPRLERGFDLHRVYAPKDRLRALPDKGYPFLIRVASNIARACHVIHSEGHVIGDVNEGNIFVAPDATVRLIDCDSFQVRHGGTLFACDVGTLHYQPPELQSVKTFRGLQRTPNHDYFGMAVQIFQLLFLGRHPHAGRFAGPEDMTLYRAITENRFAYSARNSKMTPPPGALTLQAITPALAQLFERAFSPDTCRGGRPTPEEWVRELSDFEKGAVTCKSNGNHVYFSGLSACPICAIERGTILFLPPIGKFGFANDGNTFNLATVWAVIQRVQVPQIGAAPTPQQLSAKPLQTFSDAAQFRIVRRILAGILPIAVLVAVSNIDSSAIDGGGKALWVLSSIILAAGLWMWRSPGLKKEVSDRLREAKRQYDQHCNAWKELENSRAASSIYSELLNAKQKYEELPQKRLRALDELKRNHRQHQLAAYLDRHEISKARGAISGIGPSKVVTLQSYQIETAADVTYNAVIAVPGFGPKTTQKLVDWRNALEARFRYDPSRPVDAAEVARVEREILIERTRLEKLLSEGGQRLHLEAATLTARVNALRPIIEGSARAVALEEANLRCI